LIETVAQALEKTLEYIKQGWTKEANARDKQGRACLWCDENACCWCLNGAMLKAANAQSVLTIHMHHQIWWSNRLTISGYTSLSEFNDSAESKEVIEKALECAITDLKSGRDFI
jgi:hypothetical protein